MSCSTPILSFRSRSGIDSPYGTKLARMPILYTAYFPFLSRLRLLVRFCVFTNVAPDKQRQRGAEEGQTGNRLKLRKDFVAEHYYPGSTSYDRSNEPIGWNVTEERKWFASQDENWERRSVFIRYLNIMSWTANAVADPVDHRGLELQHTSISNKKDGRGVRSVSISVHGVRGLGLDGDIALKMG